MKNTGPRIVFVRDKMQHSYRYVCSAREGKDFAPEFHPDLTPKEMLALGVFGGKYMTDCANEFPASWWKAAKLSPLKRDKPTNYFKVNASQSLAAWRSKGWIHHDDPRGWFQWYCRYYMGRRVPEEDTRQIKRWRAAIRHIAQLKKIVEPEIFFVVPASDKRSSTGLTTAGSFKIADTCKETPRMFKYVVSYT